MLIRRSPRSAGRVRSPSLITLTIDGKDLTILDSGLQVSGDVSLVGGATLVLDVPAAGP